MMTFIKTFLKNLAFVLLVLIFEISVLAFSCFDHSMFKMDGHATPFQAQHAAASEQQADHTHPSQSAQGKILECHLEVADGPSPSGSSFSVMGHDLISMDELVAPFYQPVDGRLDDLSLLIKELSLAPPEGPPRLV